MSEQSPDRRLPSSVAPAAAADAAAALVLLVGVPLLGTRDVADPLGAVLGVLAAALLVRAVTALGVAWIVANW